MGCFNNYSSKNQYTNQYLSFQICNGAYCNKNEGIIYVF